MQDDHENLAVFFCRRRRLGCKSNPGLFRLKKKYLILYSMRSHHLYCFCHRGCWNHRPFGPYFKSLLANLQCSKKQGQCAYCRWVILICHIVASSMVMCLTWRNYLPRLINQVLHRLLANYNCMQYNLLHIHLDLCTETTLILHNDNPDAVPSCGKFQTAHGSGCSILSLSTRGLSQT